MYVQKDLMKKTFWFKVRTNYITNSDSIVSLATLYLSPNRFLKCTYELFLQSVAQGKNREYITRKVFTYRMRYVESLISNNSIG